MGSEGFITTNRAIDVEWKRIPVVVCCLKSHLTVGASLQVKHNLSNNTSLSLPSFKQGLDPDQAQPLGTMHIASCLGVSGLFPG